MTSINTYPDPGGSSMFPHPSLPTNEELPFLPPLPDTPQHSYKSYSSEEYLLRAKTPITRKLWEDRLNLDSPILETPHSSMKEKEKKWDVDVDYPVLTTRQHVFNTPGVINRIPSRDILRGARTPSGSSIKIKDQTPSPESFVQPSISAQNPSIVQPSILPPINDNQLSNTFPQSLIKDQISTRHLSPVKPSESAQPRLSASFNLPTYIADASLLADQSLLGGAGSSGDEDSFHLDLQRLRPQRAISEEYEEQKKLNHSEGSNSSGSDTPTKPSYAKSSFLAPPQNPLDQSTLLPRSPAKLAHLLEPSHALNNVEAPWTGEDSQLYDSSISSRGNSLSPERPSPTKSMNILPHSQSMKGFPTASSSHSTITLPKIKRTFPASSSAQSLSSLGEEGEYPNEGGEGEISTLLPVSPMKTAYLLSDSELITKETFEDESSFKILLPSRNTPYKPSLMVKTPRKSPLARISPIKTIVRGTLHGGVPEEGDITFDVKDLLAKVNKPKRASGTEESFVDLLHDNFMPDDLDSSMMGPDESMLPPSYRSRGYRGNSASPLKNILAASPIRPTRTTELTATIKRLPTAHTVHDLASQAESIPEDTKQATISRSKSLSRVAEIIERVKSERAAAQHNDMTKEEEKEEVLVASPPKTAIRTRTYTTTRTPAASSITTARPRNSMMPPPPTSRRISLSAGAIPMTSSASLKTLELPPSRSSTVRTANRAPQGTSRMTTAARPPVTSTVGAMASRPAGVATTSSSRPPVASRTARPSMAPPSRIEPKSRMGSASSTVSSSASVPTLPTARPTTASRLTFRPSVAAPAARTATTTSTAHPTSGMPTASSRLSRPSTLTRPGGLPKPGDGPTARSAPTAASTIATTTSSRASRGFGSDATSTMNRVPRPSIATTSRTSSKLSTGPSSRGEIPKSRAFSTPASSTIPTTTSKIPPVPSLPSSRLTRPSAINPRSEGLKKSSMPPPSIPVGGVPQKSRIGSISSSSAATTRQGLPKPSIRSTTISKSSAPPTTAAGSNGQGLSALRERLDRLHARQVR